MIDVETSANRIVIRVEIGAPRDRVWQALTDGERIAQWWGDHVSLDARPGGRLTEHWTDAGGREVVTSGEVARLIASRTLELTWADDDWDEPTRVIFRLEEAADDATRLTLEHSGWEAFPRRRARSWSGRTRRDGPTTWRTWQPTRHGRRVRRPYPHPPEARVSRDLGQHGPKGQLVTVGSLGPTPPRGS